MRRRLARKVILNTLTRKNFVSTGIMILKDAQKYDRFAIYLLRVRLEGINLTFLIFTYR